MDMPAALAGIGSNDDAAVRHRHRTIAHVVNHVRIVADQHHSQIARLFQLVEQVEDLRLHRHVQRRSRFIQQQQLRPQQQCAHNRHALPLAARQLMRVAIQQARIQPHRESPR